MGEGAQIQMAGSDLPRLFEEKEIQKMRMQEITMYADEMAFMVHESPLQVKLFVEWLKETSFLTEEEKKRIIYGYLERDREYTGNWCTLLDVFKKIGKLHPYAAAVIVLWE